MCVRSLLTAQFRLNMRCVLNIKCSQNRHRVSGRGVNRYRLRLVYRETHNARIREKEREREQASERVAKAKDTHQQQMKTIPCMARVTEKERGRA